MFKQLAVGALATGLLFSGGLGVSAAELNSTVPTVNNLAKAYVESNSYLNIGFSGDFVDFEVRGLENIFHSDFYDEVIFTVEEPDSNGRLYDPNRNLALEEAKAYSSGDSNIASDSRTKSTISKMLKKIYGKDSVPAKVTVYAFVKPADKSYFVLAGEDVLRTSKLK
jgi:hypothetical protein